MYRCIITARTDVLPGKVRFDCAGPMFCEIPCVVQLGKWMTNVFPHFINIIIIIIIIIIIMTSIIINNIIININNTFVDLPN